MNGNYVITIGREYGSGGREVALKLGELLGINVYDKDLIDLTAEKKGLDKNLVAKNNEKKGLSFGKANHELPAFDSFGRTFNDRLYMLQAQVIRELADKESCVFVGRCAEHVLKDRNNVLSVFITAPMPARIMRIMERYDVTEQEAKKQIARFDKERAAYYNYYTDKHWGCSKAYNLSVDSSILGSDGTAEYIKILAEKKFKL